MDGAGLSIAVSVGSDHHRFDRLMDWLTDWDRPDHVHLKVQHGTSHTVPGASNVAFLPHSELMAWMSESDAVVLQGGPGGIIEALRLGHRPLVIPRLSEFSEVVDDHQVAFTGRLAVRRMVTLIESPQQLADHLNGVTARQRRVIDLSSELESLGPLGVASRLSSVPERIPRKRTRRRVLELLHQRDSRPQDISFPEPRQERAGADAQ